MAAAGGYTRAADLPQLIPVFPLDQALLLPRGQLPLNIFEPRYLNMVDDVMGGDRIIGMLQTRKGGDRARPPLARIGCAGRITSYAETSDGRYLITLTGISRFKVTGELPVHTPYRQVRTDFEPFESDLQPPPEVPDAERTKLLAALKAYLDRRELDIDWTQASAAPVDGLVNSLAMALPFEETEKQALLEAAGLTERLDVLIAVMTMGAAEGDNGSPRMQ
jgi:Lon protease-like protein